jgi:hypothetical protein
MAITWIATKTQRQKGTRRNSLCDFVPLSLGGKLKLCYSRIEEAEGLCEASAFSCALR